MAKTLEFSDTSAQTVKIGDTTTSFTMVLGEDSNPVDLTNVTGIVAKLGDSTGYLKSQTITPDNIPDPLSGEVIIKFDSDFMNGLPAGYYLLEVWVTYDSGTAIYPSGDLTGFTINNNIESSTGSTITTITFDDFVAAMNKAASTIAKGDKGDKGDTGTVDNTGLISAPAFQSLQTQVDNSAVGTNLLVGTTGNLTTTQVSGYDTGMAIYPLDIVCQTDTTFIARAWLHPYSHPAGVQIAWADTSNTMQYPTQEYITTGSSGYSICKVNIPAGGTLKYLTAVFDTFTNDTTQVDYKEFKLEKGSVATDWCPNPSEILTQSDYAKIKAAIVALGGTLS